MKIDIFVFIIALVVIFMISYQSNKEYFNYDTSNNKIIYDTIPFYNYMPAIIGGSPYWYNPLDYWLNPYAYYTWYGSNYGSNYGTNYGTNYGSSSLPYIKKRHVRRTRHIRR